MHRPVALSAACLLVTSCGGSDLEGIEFRAEMRRFVQEISAKAKSTTPSFAVIPQNGHALVTLDGEPGGAPASEYLAAIDGMGREDLFFGYDDDDAATPESESAQMQAFLDVGKANGVVPLVTDYCSSPANVDASYQRNAAKGYLSFAADRRELDSIPARPAVPVGAHSGDVSRLSEARNFLYLLNAERFATAEALVDALAATQYDAFVIDAYSDGTRPLSAAQVARLKTKPQGGRRLVLAYMSIGEAEDYRHYWKPEWSDDAPSFLEEENPEWKGNYKVRYWEQAWKDVIVGDGGYLDGILAAGFDGVYLDIIDAYEWFEEEYGE